MTTTQEAIADGWPVYPFLAGPPLPACNAARVEYMKALGTCIGAPPSPEVLQMGQKEQSFRPWPYKNALGTCAAQPRRGYRRTRDSNDLPFCWNGRSADAAAEGSAVIDALCLLPSGTSTPSRNRSSISDCATVQGTYSQAPGSMSRLPISAATTGVQSSHSHHFLACRVPQLQSILQAVARAFNAGIVCIAICGEHRTYIQVGSGTLWVQCGS